MLEVTAPRRSVIDLTGGVTEAVDVPPLTEVEPLDPDWLAVADPTGSARLRDDLVAGVECCHGCLLFAQAVAEAPARCSRTGRGRLISLPGPGRVDSGRPGREIMGR